MFGRNNTDEYPINEGETSKIQKRLDPDETVVISVRQSRVRPGGAAVLTPNTIFLTEKRILIRNPTRLGLGENIEEYYYHQITNVKLEKGLFSASLILSIPGLTELSKLSRSQMLWGRDSTGAIDAIPKGKAETMYVYIRDRVEEANIQEDDTEQSSPDDPMKILKTRYVKGEISKDDFEEMKKNLA